MEYKEFEKNSKKGGTNDVEEEDEEICTFMEGELRKLVNILNKMFEEEDPEKEQSMFDLLNHMTENLFPDIEDFADSISETNFFANLNEIYNKAVTQQNVEGVSIILNLMNSILNNTKCYAVHFYKSNILNSVIDNMGVIPDDFKKQSMNIIHATLFDMPLSCVEEMMYETSLQIRIIELINFTNSVGYQSDVFRILSMVFFHLKKGNIGFNSIEGYVKTTLIAIVEKFSSLIIDLEQVDQSIDLLKNVISSIIYAFDLADFDFNDEENIELIKSICNFLDENRKFEEVVEERTLRCFSTLIGYFPNLDFVHDVASHFNFIEEFSNIPEFSNRHQCCIIQLYFTILSREIVYYNVPYTFGVEDLSVLAERINECSFAAIEEMVRLLTILIVPVENQDGCIAPPPSDLCYMLLESKMVDTLYDLLAIDDGNTNSKIGSLMMNIIASLEVSGKGDLFFNNESMADWLSACEGVDNDPSEIIQELRNCMTKNENED